mgnify:CR=1 FL=1
MGTKPDSDKTTLSPDDKPRLSDSDRQLLAAATITHASRIGAVPPRREFLHALAAGFLAAIDSGRKWGEA